MRRLFIIFIAALLLAIPVGAAHAQTGVVGFVNTDLLNMRPVPSAVNNNPITQIPGGAYVLLTARTDDNQWFRVTYDSNGFTPVSGWVAARYITITEGTINQLPITNSGVPNPQTPTNVTGVINTGALNIRSVPGATNNVPIATLYMGTTVDVLGRDAGTDWYYVRFGTGYTGWARSHYVTLTRGALPSALPVVSGQAPQPIPPTVTAVIDTGALNIRPVPRWWNNLPITFLYRGTQVNVIGRNSDHSWYQVRLGDGRVGWARSTYLSVSGDVNALPVTG